jgi:uncharacterized protein (TIGR04540 family)
MQYPHSVKGLAAEIQRVTNDYYARKITNSELKDCIMFWAAHCPELLFNGERYKPTIEKIIGIRRVELLNKLLDGYQNTLFSEGAR